MTPPLEQLMVDLAAAVRDQNDTLAYVIRQLDHLVFTGEARHEASTYLHELAITRQSIANTLAHLRDAMSAADDN